MTDLDFPEELTERLRVSGLQGRGRPKKGSTAVKLAELGFTRQQSYENKRLASIPEDEVKAFWARQRAEGKTPSIRGALVHFGLRHNVVDDDIFPDTQYGELAKIWLRPFEVLALELTEQQRRLLFRAVKVRWRAISLRADMKQSQMEPKS